VKPLNGSPDAGTGPVRIEQPVALAPMATQRSDGYLPGNWLARVNRPQTAAEQEAMKSSIERTRSLGQLDWQHAIAHRCRALFRFAARAWTDLSPIGGSPGFPTERTAFLVRCLCACTGSETLRSPVGSPDGDPHGVAFTVCKNNAHSQRLTGICRPTRPGFTLLGA
jgi:hypothetical protein